jgi:hypothetical protein
VAASAGAAYPVEPQSVSAIRPWPGRFLVASFDFDGALRPAPHRTLGRPVSLTFLSRSNLTPKSHATGAYLTAGVRGDGLLEVDSTDNLLRDRFCGPLANIPDGMATLGDDRGLGIEPNLSSIETCRTV